MLKLLTGFALKAGSPLAVPVVMLGCEMGWLEVVGGGDLLKRKLYLSYSVLF